MPAVFLRTAHQPEREITALVAATDGSTAFLLMPRTFWLAPDVAPLVRCSFLCCACLTAARAWLLLIGMAEGSFRRVHMILPRTPTCHS